ncbi:MAG: type IV pili twitching motility protein PilT, partial [Rugosibacter sp.]
MSTMHKLFQLMVAKKASDLFFSCGAPITIKINGNAMSVNSTVIDPAAMHTLLMEILTPE